MGALNASFQGTPQQFADAIAARLSIITQEVFALFRVGTTEPSSDVGPWMDTSTSIGIWKVWNPETGNYQPMPVADETLRYILSNTAPDPDIFQLWVELNGLGKAISIKTWYNGAWHDIYEDTIATLNAAIANVFTPYGAAGTILTSNGPGVAPSWNTGLPIGSEICYAGITAPAGWLTEDGSIKAILSYPALFAVIGSLYGGDGITTFAVPPTPGRLRIGIGTSDAPGATPWSLGQKAGSETVQLTTPQLPIHTVDISTQRIVADGNVPNAGGGIMGFAAGSIKTSEPVGGDEFHPNMPPVLGSHWIIKYQ